MESNKTVREEWRIKQPNGYVRGIEVEIGNPIDEAYLLRVMRELGKEAFKANMPGPQIEIVPFSD